MINSWLAVSGNELIIMLAFKGNSINVTHRKKYFFMLSSSWVVKYALIAVIPIAVIASPSIIIIGFFLSFFLKLININNGFNWPFLAAN